MQDTRLLSRTPTSTNFDALIVELLNWETQNYL